MSGPQADGVVGLFAVFGPVEGGCQGDIISQLCVCRVMRWIVVHKKQADSDAHLLLARVRGQDARVANRLTQRVMEGSVQCVLSRKQSVASLWCLERVG